MAGTGTFTQERHLEVFWKGLQEQGDRQEAVQNTKEALIKRAVMGKGPEIEVIVVGRLGGLQNWSSRWKNLGKVLDLKNRSMAWFWQEYLLLIEVTGWKQLVTKVILKLNFFSIVNVRIFSKTNFQVVWFNRLCFVHKGNGLNLKWKGKEFLWEKMWHLPSFIWTEGKWAIWNWAEKDEQLLWRECGSNILSEHCFPTWSSAWPEGSCEDSSRWSRDVVDKCEWERHWKMLSRFDKVSLSRCAVLCPRRMLWGRAPTQAMCSASW